jgi:hypothetical protein
MVHLTRSETEKLLGYATVVKDALRELSCHWAFEDGAPEFNRRGIGYEARERIEKLILALDKALNVP